MQHSPLVRCGVTAFFLNLALWGVSPIAQAQIITDGTTGPGGVLSGPHYQIPAELGRKLGPNLFHSFLDFQLNSGESATFSGPASIRNILSRVTGGNPSLLDGQLNSTIGGANFFFINPAGVVFGPNAQVNVGGSFVVSSADVVKLGQSGSFNALDSSATILSSAPPQAFGFLSSNPQPIQFNGSQIEGAAGRSISVVGGGIGVYDGASLKSSGGLNLASVGSAGEVLLDANNPATPVDSKNFTQFGAVEVRNGSLLNVEGNGGISIFGQSLVVDSSGIRLDTSGSQTNTSPLQIAVVGPLILTGGSSIESVVENAPVGASIQIQAGQIILGVDGTIDSATLGAGRGGDIIIEAQQVQLADAASITSSSFGAGRGGDVHIKTNSLMAQGQGNRTGVFAISGESGSSGNLNVEAQSISLKQAAFSTSTIGAGRGGVLTIVADTLLVDAADIGEAGVTSDSTSTGSSGSVFITARDIQVKGGAAISTSSLGQGHGGSINIVADALTLEGKQVLSGIQAIAGDQGNGGTVRIVAGKLQVLGKASVLASSFGTGAAGNVNVRADQILLDGRNVALDPQNPIESSGLISESRANDSGQGGKIVIIAKDLQLRRGGGISTATYSASRGGDVVIRAGNINVDGQERLTIINAGTFDSGRSGDVDIAADSVRVVGKGLITSLTGGKGNGGDIRVKAHNVTLDGAQSDQVAGISAVSQEGSGGNGGNIKLWAHRLEVRGHIGIDSSTGSTGNSGNIDIRAKQILLDGQGTGGGGISASSASVVGGNTGTITINTDDLQIKGESSILSVTAGHGTGGQVDITAKNMLIDGQNKPHVRNIASDTYGFGDASGGKIHIKADNFQMKHGAFVSSNTIGSGNGGGIEIYAKDASVESGSVVSAITTGTGQGGNILVDADALTVNGQGQIKGQATGFSADTTYAGRVPNDNKGNGGTITLKAKGRLALINDAYVSTSTFGDDGQVATGNAGAITLSAGDVLLERSLVASLATGSGNGGTIEVDATNGSIALDNGKISVKALQAEAGNVILKANDLGVGNSSVIDAEATTANGGNIKIQVGRSFRAQLSTLSAFAQGDGGSITVNSNDDVPPTQNISPAHDILLDRALLSANAVEGKGGSIHLRSRVYLPSAESIINVSSTFGADGTIDIQSPNANVGGSLINLPSNLLGAENYLAERCVVRTTGASSSFTVEPQNGAPSRPGDLLPSPAPR